LQAQRSEGVRCAVTEAGRRHAQKCGTIMMRGSVTKRFLCIPVQSTYECKTRGKERWHCGPRVAIERCGQSKAWYAVAGTWTGMNIGAVGCARALTRFFSFLQAVKPMRTTRHQFHGKMRSRAPAKPWLDGNLFVTLPRTHAWPGRYRRNSKDYEHSTESSTAMIQISHLHLMLNRLAPCSRPEFPYRKDAA